MLRNAAQLTIATGIVLIVSSFAAAQTLGGREPEDGACFYEDTNYRGDYFCLNTGRVFAALTSSMDDRIRSIRIFGDAEVRVYEDSLYKGDSKSYDDDVRDLGRSWKDVISSVKVESRRGSRSSRRSSSSRSGVSSSQADRIVRRAYEDILDRKPDSAGLRLYRSRIVDDGWTEEQVRDALRGSPEYRELNTMTRTKARDIVRDAYRAVLKREPDPGSATYVDRVLNDDWTRADVERALRDSDEYRNRNRR